MTNLAILIGALGAWGAVHSWLASTRVKQALETRFGGAFMRGYRLAYNAFAIVSFLPILWLVRVLPDRTLYLVASPWRFGMLAIEAIAAALLVLSLLATDSLQFAGLRQLFEGDTSSRLVTGGFYRWVRHPLYFFGLVIIWFTPLMTANSLIVALGLTLYLIIGAGFEERKLLREFGAEYAAYQARTPMLIPGLRLRRVEPAYRE